MADGTKIEWSDATWNPITGCSVVSPGCQHCYAMKLAGTRLADHPSRAGLTVDTKAGPVWTGEVRFNEEWLGDPLRWRRPRMIFVCAHGDLFHEAVPDDWIDKVFGVMARAQRHTFQVLTKRAERMRAYLGSFRRCPTGFITRGGEEISSYGGPIREGIFQPDRWPLPNVWLGVSAEDQQRADERIPHLLATPAAVRWVSAEPLLGSVNLRDLPIDQHHGALGLYPKHTRFDALHPRLRARLDWIVAGGEGGPGARPMHPDWARSLRDQCAAAEVPFFWKQWGEWADASDVGPDEPILRDVRRRERNSHRVWYFETADSTTTMLRVGKKAAGRLLDGVLHNAMPEVGR